MRNHVFYFFFYSLRQHHRSWQSSLYRQLTSTLVWCKWGEKFSPIFSIFSVAIWYSLLPLDFALSSVVDWQSDWQKLICKWEELWREKSPDAQPPTTNFPFSSSPSLRQPEGKVWKAIKIESFRDWKTITCSRSFIGTIYQTKLWHNFPMLDSLFYIDLQSTLLLNLLTLTLEKCEIASFF